MFRSRVTKSMYFNLSSNLNCLKKSLFKNKYIGTMLKMFFQNYFSLLWVSTYPSAHSSKIFPNLNFPPIQKPPFSKIH